MNTIKALLADQDGIISRRQALQGGLTRAAIAGRLKRREWVTVHPGVYAAQTGRLSWQQRAWAAVLASWPAALSHESSLRAFEGPGRRGRDTARIHVAVTRDRNLVAPEGVRLHRVSRLDARVQRNLSPPRVRYDDAVLDVAAAARSELDAIATLADACGSRRTTAHRLLDTLEQRPRIARRGWLEGVLRDVADGTCSVLEHAYLVRVERPHGLPSGRRQARAVSDGRSMFRDVDYGAVVVELDGRLFHDDTAVRDRDLERDLDAAIEGKDTIRLGYGQVLERGCSTAAKVGAVLRARGWGGVASACPECDPLAECG
jgi:hypothetical protein